MSSSPIQDAPSPLGADFSDDAAADNNLQPFFVLHKALLRKPEDKATGSSRRTRRKIDLLSSPFKSSEKSNDILPEELGDAIYNQLRFEAFERTWSKIEATIKEVLREANLNLFEDVRRWVQGSFSTTKSARSFAISEIQRSFPLVTDSVCKRIPTAFILTKNVEFVDDLLTFRELGDYLKSNGCHVANLLALDFSAKHGIGGCLRSLLRQLVAEAPDTADIAVIASWYCEPTNYDSPIIVIIDDMERCNGGVLSEFITLVSEWAIKVPIIFIMGVTTTIDAPRTLLPSDALKHLGSCKFTLGSPCERMNALVEAVLVKPSSGLVIGHKVAVFLRNYFLRHDGTITSFISALKVACIKHFTMEPLSFLGQGILDEDSKTFWQDKCEALPNSLNQYLLHLPSCQRGGLSKGRDDVTSGLSELRKQQKYWTSAVMCLFEVAKCCKLQLLDVLCESLDPKFSSFRVSDHSMLSSYSTYNIPAEDKICYAKGGFIVQAIHKVRELSATALFSLVNVWNIHTGEMAEIHGTLRELQAMMRSADDGKTLKDNCLEIHKSRSPSLRKNKMSLNDKAAAVLESIVRNFLMPIECVPFHEILCFKHVNALQSALIGDPRRTIQVDLLKSQLHLKPSCCHGEKVNSSSPTHDTSIMYSLAQEYGDLINLHDWYQSFKALIHGSSSKTRRKVQNSPVSKKVKATPVESEVTTQARFCRAVTELQVTGLLRMPSKRRPDFVQRVAFGI